MKYKDIVLYRERAYDNRDESKPSIEDNLNKLSEETAKKVVAYLESGLVLREYVSPTTDPYDQKTRLPVVIYTDGEYIWDSIIIHWVAKYRVNLPETFLNHVLTHQRFPDIDLMALDDDMLKNPEEIWIDS